MARRFVADGVETVACTPHILPGLYHNTGPQIRAATAALREALADAGIALELTTGADVHITPDMLGGLRAGTLLSLADSRYVLVEPPHHVAPPGLEDLLFGLLVQGYVPILTHPERLTWIGERYHVVGQLVAKGVWVQITAGSLAGAFRRNAQYLAERMLDEGLVHIIATDAHDTRRRPPDLARGRELAARRVGEAEAANLVLHRPRGVLANAPSSSLPPPLALAGGAGPSRRGSAPDSRGHDGANDRGGGLEHLARRVRRLFG